MRGHIQQFIQRLLVEEVTMRLVRAKSERLVAVDAPEGYRNEYGKPPEADPDKRDDYRAAAPRS